MAQMELSQAAYSSVSTGLSLDVVAHVPRTKHHSAPHSPARPPLDQSLPCTSVQVAIPMLIHHRSTEGTEFIIFAFSCLGGLVFLILKAPQRHMGHGVYNFESSCLRVFVVPSLIFVPSCLRGSVFPAPCPPCPLWLGMFSPLHHPASSEISHRRALQTSTHAHILARGEAATRPCKQWRMEDADDREHSRRYERAGNTVCA